MKNRMPLFVSDRPDETDIVNRVVLIIFFAWIAVMFTTPVGEGDFFWHVKTGEWIWQHKALPDSDPFSFTIKDVNPYNPESGRIPFLLKQYWLGQLFFYGIWKFAGEAGMVVFRSACFTWVLFFLYRWSRRYQQGIVPLLTVVIAGNVLRNYSGERPQIFAFMLMPVLIFLLEQIRTAEKPGAASLPVIALPAVMLLWSNCHGSFILGIVMIALSALGHLVERFKSGEKLNLFKIRLYAGAILVTLINPNGFGAFKEFFSLSKSYTNQVAEFTSPIVLAYKYNAVDYFYWMMFVAALITIITSFKKMSVAHILVISSLMGLSLTGTRYIPFALMATPLLAIYIPELRPGKLRRLLPAIVVLPLILTANYGNVLKFRAERAFPEKASRFLNEVKPRGNMFNYIGWGGYLMCYNSYPVFIDGRTLVEELLTVHNNILTGREWQATLNRYGINFMIIPGTDAISLQAYPLLLQLLSDNSWALIYHDEVALVLLRNSPENYGILERYATDKSAISSHIQARWKWQLTNDF